MEPLLPVREVALGAASALRGVGTVEVGDVLIAYVSEPGGRGFLMSAEAL